MRFSGPCSDAYFEAPVSDSINNIDGEARGSRGRRGDAEGRCDLEPNSNQGQPSLYRARSMPASPSTASKSTPKRSHTSSLSLESARLLGLHESISAARLPGKDQASFAGRSSAFGNTSPLDPPSRPDSQDMGLGTRILGINQRPVLHTPRPSTTSPSRSLLPRANHESDKRTDIATIAAEIKSLRRDVSLLKNQSSSGPADTVDCASSVPSPALLLQQLHERMDQVGPENHDPNERILPSPSQFPVLSDTSSVQSIAFSDKTRRRSYANVLSDAQHDSAHDDVGVGRTGHDMNSKKQVLKHTKQTDDQAKARAVKEKSRVRANTLEVTPRKVAAPSKADPTQTPPSKRTRCRSPVFATERRSADRHRRAGLPSGWVKDTNETASSGQQSPVKSQTTDMINRSTLRKSPAKPTPRLSYAAATSTSLSRSAVRGEKSKVSANNPKSPSKRNDAKASNMIPSENEVENLATGLKRLSIEGSPQVSPPWKTVTARNKTTMKAGAGATTNVAQPAPKYEDERIRTIRPATSAETRTHRNVQSVGGVQSGHTEHGSRIPRLYPASKTGQPCTATAQNAVPAAQSSFQLDKTQAVPGSLQNQAHEQLTAAPAPTPDPSQAAARVPSSVTWNHVEDIQLVKTRVPDFCSGSVFDILNDEGATHHHTTASADVRAGASNGYIRLPSQPSRTPSMNQHHPVQAGRTVSQATLIRSSLRGDAPNFVPCHSKSSQQTERSTGTPIAQNETVITPEQYGNVVDQWEKYFSDEEWAGISEYERQAIIERRAGAFTSRFSRASQRGSGSGSPSSIYGRHPAIRTDPQGNIIFPRTSWMARRAGRSIPPGLGRASLPVSPEDETAGWAIGSARPGWRYGWRGGDGREIAFTGYGPDAERDPNSPVSFSPPTSGTPSSASTTLVAQGCSSGEQNYTAGSRESSGDSPLNGRGFGEMMSYLLPDGLAVRPCGNYDIRHAVEHIGMKGSSVGWCHSCAQEA